MTEETTPTLTGTSLSATSAVTVSHNGIYLAGGSELLPVRVMSDGDVTIVPVLTNNLAVFPSGDSICTYGWNLPVDNYKGKMEDWIGNNTLNKKYGYDTDKQFTWESTNGTASSATGLAACPKTGTTQVCVFPMFNSVNTALNLQKQKMRGDMYTAYDDYLGVLECTKDSSAWRTGSVMDTSSSMKFYAYSINNTDQGGSNRTVCNGGWALFRFDFSAQHGRTLSSIIPTIDVVWVSDYSGSPYWTQSSATSGYNQNCMILQHPNQNNTSSITLSSNRIQLDHVTEPYTKYNFVTWGSTAVGNGRLIISPPKFHIYTNGTHFNCRLMQWGITFGTHV